MSFEVVTILRGAVLALGPIWHIGRLPTRGSAYGGKEGDVGEKTKGEGEGERERGLLTRVIGVDVADMACEMDEAVGR